MGNPEHLTMEEVLARAATNALKSASSRSFEGGKPNRVMSDMDSHRKDEERYQREVEFIGECSKRLDDWCRKQRSR